MNKKTGCLINQENLATERSQGREQSWWRPSQVWEESAEFRDLGVLAPLLMPDPSLPYIPYPSLMGALRALLIINTSLHAYVPLPQQ